MLEIVILSVVLALHPSQAKAIIPWRDSLKTWIASQKACYASRDRRQKIVKHIKKSCRA